MQTKKEWIEELTKKRHIVSFFEKKIDGKKKKLSYFSYYATEEHKNDKELNILNFIQTRLASEVPQDMIDHDFISQCFRLNESANIIQLPYEWKNNSKDKQLLKEIIDCWKNKTTYNENKEMMWTFEPGFWSDISYTEQVRKYNYYMEVAVISYLNKSDNIEHKNYLFEIVNKTPYYLKYLKSSYKNLLPQETILSYAKDYGITPLTKEQKNRYEVIKEAFHNHKINYDKLDNKWKNAEVLIDLLDNKSIWTTVINGKQFMSINDLTLELLSNEDIIKSCLSAGHILLELRKNTYSASKWFLNKELKKIALKTYVDYKIIEDCIDDKDMVLHFLTELKNKHKGCFFSGKHIYEQTKYIDKILFKDKEIMSMYLSIDCLSEKIHFTEHAIEALESYKKEDIIDFFKINKDVYKVTQDIIKDYSKEDIIKLVKINKDVYNMLSEEMKSNWEIILPYVEELKSIGWEIPRARRDEISEIKSNIFEDKLDQIRKNALNEKLSHQLENKGAVKRLKI